MINEDPAVEQDALIEERVLGMISSTPVRTSDLMKRAGERGLSSADVRETVWLLLDDGRLHLTSDRCLVPARTTT